MKRLGEALRKILLVSLLLLTGQIPVGDRTMGGHLAHGLYRAIVWVGDSLRDADWFAKMSEVASEPGAEKAKSRRLAVAPKQPPTTDPTESRGVEGPDSVKTEQITPTDRESMIQLLNEPH